MAESKEDRPFVLPISLDRIDRPADIGSRDIFKDLNSSCLRIHLDLCPTPANFPKGRGRAQDSLFTLHVPINSSTDDFSRLASEMVRNYLAVRDPFAPAIDFAILKCQLSRLFAHRLSGCAQKLLLQILGRPLNRKPHDGHRTTRAGGDRKSTRLNSSHSQISY